MARARCLLRDSGIPHALWLEVVKTVTYLLNRTPNKQLKWASPLERAYQWLRANRPALYRHIQEDTSQNLAYLRIYGCRAYPLTTEALQGMQKRRLKLQPHAHIGYLVGYKSSTQYVIWVPQLDRCIDTSHVSFDERTTYGMVRHEPVRLQQKEALRDAADQLETSDDHNDTQQTIDPITQAPRSRLDASREVGGENQGHDNEIDAAGEKEPADEPPVYPTPPLETPQSPDVLDTIIVRTGEYVDEEEADQSTTGSIGQTEQQEDQEEEPQGLQEAQTQQNQEPRGLQEHETRTGSLDIGDQRTTSFTEADEPQGASQGTRRSSRQTKLSTKAQESEAVRAEFGDRVLGRIHAVTLEESRKWHCRDVPPPPSHYNEAKNHQFSRY